MLRFVNGDLTAVPGLHIIFRNPCPFDMGFQIEIHSLAFVKKLRDSQSMSKKPIAS